MSLTVACRVARNSNFDDSLNVDELRFRINGVGFGNRIRAIVRHAELPNAEVVATSANFRQT